MWPVHTPLVDRLIQRAAEQYPRIISCDRSLSFWKYCQGAAPWLLRAKPQPKKKADVAKHPEVFGHVGLLCNEPPGQAGLLFILSSDDSHSSFPRSRLPLLAGSFVPYIIPRESAKTSKMSSASSYYAALDTYRLTIRCGTKRAREVGDQTGHRHTLGTVPAEFLHVCAPIERRVGRCRDGRAAGGASELAISYWK
jgi:hypothetical protein